MRERDEVKEKAVIDATVKVVNEIGFASASISKIAKEAKVSVGTIYIYHENKEALMVNTYYDVKHQITAMLYRDFDEQNSVKDNLKSLWSNTLKAGEEISKLLSYSEQFTNSPFYDLVDKAKIYELMKPLLNLMQKGEEQNILKSMPFEEFVAFFLAPANFLGNRKLCSSFDVNNENIDRTFEIAWKVVSDF